MISLKFLDFEPSSYCAAKCLMCPREKSTYKDIHMSFDIFKKAIDEAANNGGTELVRFCGMGDPFCDKGFIEKLKYIKKEYPHILTSVTNTLNTYDEQLFHYIDSILVSCYGVSKEVYERVHGGACKYEKTMENMNKLLALPNHLKPYITLSFLLLPQNESELEEWKAKWGGKADEIMVWKPHGWAGTIKDINTLINKKGKPKSCGRPFYRDILIKANGLVTVCCHDYNATLAIGDLREQSLATILEGEKLKYIQKVHKERAFNGCGLICEECDQLYDRTDALIYTSVNRTVGEINLGGKFQKLSIV